MMILEWGQRKNEMKWMQGKRTHKLALPINISYSTSQITIATTSPFGSEGHPPNAETISRCA